MTPSRMNVVSALLTLGIVTACSTVVFAQKPGGPAGVATSQAVEVQYSSRKSFVGTLFPLRETTVGSAVDGRVVEVLVDAGDRVGRDSDNSTPAPFRGQPLARLRTGTLDIEIEAAEIQYNLARKTYEELELGLPADIKVAEAELQQNESQRALAETDFKILQDLRKNSNAVSEIEMERSRSAFLAATQAVRGAKLKLEKLESTMAVQLAQSRLAMEARQQELVRLRDLREKYTIRAPFDGVVAAKMTEVGAWVTPGSEVARVLQLDPIEIVLNVPQEFVGKLQASLDRTVTLTFDGVDQILTGKIQRIVPQLDIRSRTIPVRVGLQNPKLPNGSYLLQPGMQGSATFAIGAPTQMTLIPKDALVLDGGRAHIFSVVAADGGSTKAHRIPVQTGISVGEWVQVTGDLQPGDTVVVLGNERLREGQELNILEEKTDRPKLEPGS